MTAMSDITKVALVALAMGVGFFLGTVYLVPYIARRRLRRDFHKRRDAR